MPQGHRTELTGLVGVDGDGAVLARALFRLVPT
jgi:hypothetical protein